MAAPPAERHRVLDGCEVATLGSGDARMGYTMPMPELGPVATAILGGFLPALLWLWFWLMEDRRHPEPKHLIALAFFAGMLTVAVVIPIQKAVALVTVAGTTLTFVAWSFIEEAAKFLFARVTVLKRREADEPLDMVIYMVVVALGFAAAENALFLLSPLAGDGVIAHLLTGNLRFVGATLLHLLSSAALGLVMAFAFYKPKRARRWAAFFGVILAGLLHSLFNFLILNAPSEHLFRTFALVWIGVIGILAGIEVVKRMHRRK